MLFEKSSFVSLSEFCFQQEGEKESTDNAWGEKEVDYFETMSRLPIGYFCWRKKVYNQTRLFLMA